MRWGQRTLQPSHMTGRLLEDQGAVWVVAAVSFLLFLVGNLPWQLDDYDQAKQAYTSFEMIKEGRWFYQQTPHERVATKPPLVGWVSAGLFAMTRLWELSWRLPSLLAAVALAVLLFRTASSAYGSIAGLVALSAFGLNLLTPRLATLVRTDMALAFVIFLVGLLIWQKIERQEEWKPRDRVYLFALLTIAMLIKIAIFDLASRRWRIGTALREISPGTFWLLCWSVGGLIVMSLVPSKRVDRIFPVIPPLCLLLAAQVSSGFSSLRRPDALSRTGWRLYLAIALLFAILFTGGYTIWKVVTGYRDHRYALAVF